MEECRCRPEFFDILIHGASNASRRVITADLAAGGKAYALGDTLPYVTPCAKISQASGNTHLYLL